MEYKIIEGTVAHALLERSTISTQSPQQVGYGKYHRNGIKQVREQGKKSFVLVDKKKWRQSGAKEIKLRNGRSRRVNFPDLLNYRSLFGEKGSIKKNVSWIKVMKGLEGQSRAICYYIDKTRVWLIFPSRYLALSQHLTWNFKIKKKKSRKHNPWVKVKEYLNLTLEFFFPQGEKSYYYSLRLKKRPRLRK